MAECRICTCRHRHTEKTGRESMHRTVEGVLRENRALSVAEARE